MKIILVSGLPGSGKTTWAKQYKDNFFEEEHAIDWEIRLFAADDYFEKYNESSELIYKFDPSRIAEAHSECFESVMWSMKSGECDEILVHNTFTQNWEISPYVALANAFGWDYEIVRLICGPTHARLNNVHNVPEEVINNMLERMEKPLPFWEYREEINNWKKEE